MSKILIIGPKMTEDNLSYGGVVVLFNDFINQLKKHHINHTIIDINKNKYKYNLFVFIVINFKILLNLKKHSHISLHGTANNFIFLGPILVIYCKLFNKKLSLRKFAGNFDKIYQNSSIYKKKIIEFILMNSDCVFFETKYLIDFFIKFNVNTYWFPNVRSKSEFNTDLNFNKKFIYVGNIQEEKGIDDLLNAIKYLPSDYSVDFYGNIKEDKYYDKDKWQNKIISYEGVIKPSEVQKKISKYDVLILPSYREGYPGVIIEAFSVGVPVIATELKGISEIVKNGVSGILVPTNNPVKLSEAIKYFDNENYLQFCNDAKLSFNNFETTIKTNEIIKLILNES